MADIERQLASSQSKLDQLRSEQVNGALGVCLGLGLGLGLLRVGSCALVHLFHKMPDSCGGMRPVFFYFLQPVLFC